MCLGLLVGDSGVTGVIAGEGFEHLARQRCDPHGLSEPAQGIEAGVCDLHGSVEVAPGEKIPNGFDRIA